MKVPDKLFIPKNIGFVSLAMLTTEYPDDIVYIRKEALMEWLRQRISLAGSLKSEAYKSVIDKLNSL